MMSSTHPHAAASATFAPAPFLTRALLADAAMSGAAGALMAGGAGILASLLALPEPLLRYAGLFLLPYAALVAWLGTRERLTRGAVLAVVAINAAWTIASVLLLIGGWVAPNALGIAFVLAQAAAVGLFAELQIIGLNRSTRA